MPQTSSTDRRQIASLVSRLLAHYWTADDRVETREAQIEDWIIDLAEFGPEIVVEACVAWRRQPGGRRPTPGDIRALCIRERAEHPPTDRAAIEGPVDREAWARSLGWTSYLERQDTIAENAERMTAGLRWQQEHATEMRAAKVRGFKSAATALGVTATQSAPADAPRVQASQREMGGE